MTERNVELLATDLDGTLVDSAPDIAHCVDVALESIGHPRPGEARTRAWIGDGLETLIARAISGTGGPAESGEAQHKAALAAFLECYAVNLYVRSKLYPNVADTLDALLARGIRLCCVTNKRYAFSQELLLQAGIRDRFELLVGGDSLAEKKPSPLPLQFAADKLGVETHAVALVGDSHQDLRAARAAGCGFVLASYGYGKVDETELGASPRIGSFAELPEALRAS